MSEDEILEAMRSVVDPELGINVVDLGLVYSTEISGNDVRIRMTMTTPACPLHSYLTEMVDNVVRERFPDVGDVRVELVWEPEWNPTMMSEAAKRQLGW